ncbi:hypothetical protein KIF24_11385 [Micromonospora sp. Llam7]|uniref:hypothetical protein n=1 Tax=Micromonospora tarapacensis TaxID=2835305 RepID=UPI001C839530|nr:hypothetical protein [Micromonospora tarapacensis]MBX7266580.1 hypothetical protein [Micromonospora tarapacensis]
MHRLPVTYDIPRDLMRYAVMAAVVTTATLGGVLWATFVAGEVLLVAVLVVAAGWAFILVRCRSLGTTVTRDGITRNRFVGAQHLAWQDITDLAIQDRHAAVGAYGFQVASRYLVTVSTHHRQRKLLLLFLDERAFSHDVHAFVAELSAIGALWEQHRHPGTAP